MSIENVLVRSNGAGTTYVRLVDIPPAYKAMLWEWMEDHHVPELRVSGETEVIRSTDWFTFVSRYHRGALNIS
jgi:hypothetical protein